MPSSDEDQLPVPQMVTKPANLLMASDPDGCEQLKRLVSGEDATTMVVVLARNEEQDSCANKQQEESKPRMDPHLLMALRTGNLEKLEQLLTDDGRRRQTTVGSRGEEGTWNDPSIQAGTDTSSPQVGVAATATGPRWIRGGGLPQVMREDGGEGRRKMENKKAAGSGKMDTPLPLDKQLGSCTEQDMVIMESSKKNISTDGQILVHSPSGCQYYKEASKWPKLVTPGERGGRGIAEDEEEAGSGEMDTPLPLDMKVESCTEQDMVADESSKNVISADGWILVHSPSGRQYYKEASKWPKLVTPEERRNRSMLKQCLTLEEGEAQINGGANNKSGEHAGTDATNNTPCIRGCEDELDSPAKCGEDAHKRISSCSSSGRRVDDHTGGNSNAGALLLNGVTFDSEGDSALHVVAAAGDSKQYLKCAEIIYAEAKHLLQEINKKGDTPVHCAARAGNRNMVSCLIEMAASENNGALRHELLRKQNKIGDTALHSAIRSGNFQLIKMLLWEDPELACIPDVGTSPLYLAISSSELCLHCVLPLFQSHRFSASGPDGQNILHIAVFRGVTRGKALRDVLELLDVPSRQKFVLEADNDGNTPLHYAASKDIWVKSLPRFFLDIAVGLQIVYPFCILRRLSMEGPTKLLIEASNSSLFKPDNEGSYPIHVAAASGRTKAFIVMLESFPSCAALRDGRGRTFLHVAAEKNKWDIVGYASRSHHPEVRSVLNMQDNNGNTALHLAVKGGNQWVFRYLFRNRGVRLDLLNKDGLTAIDLAWCKMPATRGRFYFTLNPRFLIFRVLVIVRAPGIFSRNDKFHKEDISEIDEDRLSDNVTKGSQVMGILAGLVTSVTFAAASKLPGGYRDQGDGNGETPTLAGRYAFDAFITAIALTFICSLLATIGLIYSGFDAVDFTIRMLYFNRSHRLLQSSARSLATAFGLGIYLVMFPVAPKIAISVCVIVFGGLFFQHFEIHQSFILIDTIRMRLGLWAALLHPILHSGDVVPLPLKLVVEKFWSLMVIFLLPAPWIYWTFLIIVFLLSGYL